MRDRLDDADGVRRRGLNGFDLRADFTGRLGGLSRKTFDLGCNHCKALAGLAGAGGFDRRIEREQVGLVGDAVDQLDDLANLLTSHREAGHHHIGFVRLLNRLSRNRQRHRGLAADLADRGRELLGPGRNGGHVRRGLRRCADGRIDTAGRRIHRMRDLAEIDIDRFLQFDPAQSVFHLSRDVGREFDDLDDVAFGIGDRIIRRLNPDRAIVFADPLEFAGLILAAPKPNPKFSIGVAIAIGFIDKHAVMLALNVT